MQSFDKDIVVSMNKKVVIEDSGTMLILPFMLACKASSVMDNVHGCLDKAWPTCLLSQASTSCLVSLYTWSRMDVDSVLRVGRWPFM